MSKETRAFRVKAYSDWQQLLEAAEELLLEREAESNLVWEVGRVSTQNKRISRPWSGWLVNEGNNSMLAALSSVTGYVILSAGDSFACHALADYLVARSIPVKGVSGPEPVSGAFAQAWKDITGENVILGASLSFYLADTEMEIKTGVEGILRRAQPEEGALLRGWAIDFGAESIRPMDPRALTRLSERMLGRKDLFVWVESDELVSMGGFGRETPHGLVINMVYTPKNRRGRGFGGALASGLVEEARARGKKYCCLYSEFSSSVRQNLYDRIGFQPAGEFAERAFNDQSDSVPSDLQ